jgi:hypothetical protein
MMINASGENVFPVTERTPGSPELTNKMKPRRAAIEERGADMIEAL